MSCSHSQGIGSTSQLASDWLHNSEQPIRSQASKLTQLLTMTTTRKFPSLLPVGLGGDAHAKVLGAGGAEVVWLLPDMPSHVSVESLSFLKRLGAQATFVGLARLNHTGAVFLPQGQFDNMDPERL